LSMHATPRVAHRWLCAAQRWRSVRAASSVRQFYQRIDEQHLAHELRNLSESAHGAPANPQLFDPVVRAKPARYASIRPDAVDDEYQAPATWGPSKFNKQSTRKPWLRYESLRGTTYPSGPNTKGPRWQDLTHCEAQRLQEMYMRKKMLDRKLLWLKHEGMLNPRKEAKLAMHRAQRFEQQEKANFTLYPPPVLDTDPNVHKMEGAQNRAQRMELESRFRSRIRLEKIANSKMLKAESPDIGDIVTDPLKRHVWKRLVRQRSEIYKGMETVLTRNSAQVLQDFLKGAAISIVKIRALKPRATQTIYYNLTSDHDPDWVKKQLKIVTPKLRSQFAVKVNPGQVTNFRFVPYDDSKKVKRRYLWRFGREASESIPVGGDLSDRAPKY